MAAGRVVKLVSQFRHLVFRYAVTSSPVCACVSCVPPRGTQELPEGGLHNLVLVCATTLLLRGLALIFDIPIPAQESYLLRRMLALPDPKLLLVPALYDLGQVLVSLTGKWGDWGTWKAGSQSVP